MKLSHIEQSLLLAAYFRGNTQTDDRWISCSDQIVVLSLFYTGDISFEQCEARFLNRGYVSGLYDETGNLDPQVRSRYESLLQLLKEQPALIAGAGNLALPSDPTFTACRLTDTGIELIASIISGFPCHPEFPNWPDRRKSPDRHLS